MLPILVRQALSYLNTTIGLEARTVCEPTQRQARLRVLGLTASLPIEDPFSTTVHLSADKTVARAIFERLFSQEIDEDEESNCHETLNETLNIIVGNCMEAFSKLGIRVTVCPPFAQQEDPLQAESLFAANSAFACPIDTNAGRALLLFTSSRMGAADVRVSPSGAATEPVEENSSSVLIVDDSAISRRIIRKMLTDIGCTVVAEAADGFDAIQAYRRWHPDLVTMDLTMPKMDGLHAVRQILAQWPDANIIIITSNNQEAAVAAARTEGARYYIVKPFCQETLRRKVAEAVGACSECLCVGACECAI